LASKQQNLFWNIKNTNFYIEDFLEAYKNTRHIQYPIPS